MKIINHGTGWKRYLLFWSVLFTSIISLLSCSLRDEEKARVYVIGDNTVMPDNRRNRQPIVTQESEAPVENAVGWGRYLTISIDYEKYDYRILGGRYSSRSIIGSRQWQDILNSINKGDIVIIGFGNFENSPPNPSRDNRAAGVLPGTNGQTETVGNEITELQDTVHTYGWYLENIIKEVRARKAVPVILSSIPDPTLDNEYKRDLSLWARQTAEKNKVQFIDLYGQLSDIYKKLDKERVAEFYTGNSLTNDGAYLVAEVVYRNLRSIRNFKKYFVKKFPAKENIAEFERSRSMRPTVTPKLQQNKDHIKDPYQKEGNLPPRQMEKLGRGLVAFKQDDGSVFISWRMIGTDPESVAFNLYRKTGANVVRVNENPIADVTWFIDSLADESKNNEWFVKTVINGVETESSKSFSIASRAPAKNYISIPLKTIEGYRPNDASVADLDGDGEYEIIVKWEARQYDNARPGLAEGTTKIDAYKLDGTFLWRIDLGPNIREGAHYTHFMVYDFDGDGKAELICKTAEGTVDGLGNVITDESGRVNLYADTVSGYILDGPEYFSVFDGMTGKELARENYIERGPREDWPKTWGDSYGNRMDRFLAGVGYFDGQRPSVILCRGYYGRAVIEAWNWREGELTRLWRFDSDDGTEGNTAYRGQGNHSLSVADVDGDGKDEIIYGAAAIDHDGKGLYTTGLGHGDALHVADHDPDRPGLEVFQPHESHPNSHGLEYRDARTGVSLWGVYTDYDVGRAIAVDIDPRHRGSEMWGVRTALYNVKGEKISDQAPVSMNFAIWWDGDLLRELLDKNYISKWDWENSKLDVIFVAEGCRANNGSKATPAISADIFGDWREEVIFPTEDNTELRIFSTTIPTEYRFYTFMHDYVYRLGVAAQNTGYNQPPHVSFFLGDGVEAQPKANIYYPN